MIFEYEKNACNMLCLRFDMLQILELCLKVKEKRSQNFDFSFLPPLPEPRVQASEPSVKSWISKKGGGRMHQTSDCKGKHAETC